MKEKLNINEMIKSAAETIGQVENIELFLPQRNRVKIPNRCATVIAARHQSGTHSLSTDTIQRRVDQIIQFYSNF